MWLLNCSSYCDTRLESYYFFKEMPSSELIPVLLLQRISELSIPSYIIYTLVYIVSYVTSSCWFSCCFISEFHSYSNVILRMNWALGSSFTRIYKYNNIPRHAPSIKKGSHVKSDYTTFLFCKSYQLHQIRLRYNWCNLNKTEFYGLTFIIMLHVANLSAAVLGCSTYACVSTNKHVWSTYNMHF